MCLGVIYRSSWYTTWRERDTNRVPVFSFYGEAFCSSWMTVEFIPSTNANCSETLNVWKFYFSYPWYKTNGHNQFFLRIFKNLLCFLHLHLYFISVVKIYAVLNDSNVQQVNTHPQQQKKKWSGVQYLLFPCCLWRHHLLLLHFINSQISVIFGILGKDGFLKKVMK